MQVASTGFLLETYTEVQIAQRRIIKLFELLAWVKQQAKITHLLVMGDFNMPEIDYNDYSVAGLNVSFSMRFFNLSQDLFLIQHVFEATRFRGDQPPSNWTMYLPMKKIENSIENYIEKYISSLGLSDHIDLLWKCTYSVSTVHRQILLPEYIGKEIIPLWLKYFLV